MLVKKKLTICLSSVFLVTSFFSINVHATAHTDEDYKRISSSYIANSPYNTKGYYIGVFGGGSHVRDVSTSQLGTVFFPAAVGGPVVVDATGNSGGTGAVVGMHFGYQWHGWDVDPNSYLTSIKPAVEVEGYYLPTNQKDYLFNPTNQAQEHFFDDNFPMNTGVILLGTVFTFKSKYYVDPYVGLGLGTAVISISDATSRQNDPAEPGINHFNSNPDSHNWTFATQMKLGLRYQVTKNIDLFAEYRLLYMNSTDYSFGSTQYSTHVPTTNWNVTYGDMAYSMGSLGFDYSL